jgi:hypothetical protein
MARCSVRIPAAFVNSGKLADAFQRVRRAESRLQAHLSLGTTTQIAAPSNELSPATLIVRFDPTNPPQAAEAGKAIGSFTFI